MSIANLLQANTYDIYSGSLQTNNIVLENANNINSVQLSCNTNNTLVIGETGANDILAGGIQFNPSQNILNYYLELSSSQASALQVSTPIGTIENLNSSRIKISRVGNIVTINLPSFSTIMNPNGNITTPYQLITPLPSQFRPLVLVSSLFTYITTHFGQKSGVISITPSGVISWTPMVDVVVPGNPPQLTQWDSDSSTTSVDVFRVSFSYVI